MLAGTRSIPLVSIQEHLPIYSTGSWRDESRHSGMITNSTRLRLAMHALAVAGETKCIAMADTVFSRANGLHQNQSAAPL
jgi:hypothetical protein